MRVFAMRALIVSIVFALLGVSATVYAVKKGGEVVELNRQIVKINKDNKDKIDNLNKEHAAQIQKLQDERDRDNEIQYGLADILSKLSKLGINVNEQLNQIKNRPIYNVRCTDNDGLQQINKYAGKTPAEINRN